MIKYVHPLPELTPQISDVYQQVKRDFGLVGDIFKMHSLSPLLLKGFWASFRESEIAGTVSRNIKEAVALAVSKTNECPFCIDAHSLILIAAGDRKITQLIMENQIDKIPDKKMKSIVNWALATRSPGSSILANPPFTINEAPEIIGTVVINHYINRMIDVLVVDKSPLPIKNSLLKKTINKFVIPLFSFLINKRKISGESLHFLTEELPETDLSEDFNWAQSHSVIKQAFTYFAKANEEAGNQILSPETRIVVTKYINSWDGKVPGISRNWVENVVQSLNGSSKTTAKLALLTAIAPYQIDDQLLQEFRSFYKEDLQLLNLVSWSSFTVSRRIGSWLSLPK